MTTSFSIAPTPLLHFGAGKIAALPSIIRNYGTNVLLVTGARSFTSSSEGQKLLDAWSKEFHLHLYHIATEPSLSLVDDAVQQFFERNIDVVIAIGGGSVLDAGKAISAMLPLNEPVKDFLEGVGTKNHPGEKIPFVAIPTTSGTGSEATKNAVISEIGVNGFKKSLRHNNFIPDVALLDPALTVNTPASITAWTGMDAFTQLMEAYVSTSANSFTDAIAFEGLKLVAQSLEKAVNDGTDLRARSDMALAAYYSGIVLANAGLGVVHGFASPIGGFYNIPHGVICSRLMRAPNEVTVEKLRKESPSHIALHKYCETGKLFSTTKNQNNDYYIDFLLELIGKFAHSFPLPPLEIRPADIEKIVAGADSKNNPVKLDRDNLLRVLTLSVQ